MNFTTEQQILQSQELFGNRLFEKLKCSGNLLFSPLSLHAILSVLHGCAEKDTKKALSLVLHILESQSIIDEYDKILTHISNLPDIRLLNEFKLITPAECSLKPYVVDIFRKLNIAVESGTQDKLIIVSSLRLQSVLANKFDEMLNDAMPSKRGFKVCRDQEVEVDMMSSISTYKYKSDEHLSAKIIEIPLINKDVSMLVILPNDPYGIDQLQTELGDFDLEELTDHLNYAFLDVTLPKIKLELSANIRGALEQIKLKDIFDQDVAKNLVVEGAKSRAIDEIISKVYLEVNEGKRPTPPSSESCSDIKYSGGCCCQVITDDVHVDHPFIMYIIAKGEIPYVILQGKILNPLETV